VSPRKKAPEKEFSDPRDYFEGEILESYTHSKSMMRIQEQIALRILEISEAEFPGLVLDLGMGAGFSSVPMYLNGFTVIGLELIWDMLIQYPISELNPIAGNMLNLPFRKDTFDFIFSVSAFQWTLTEKGKINYTLLQNMFQRLHDILNDTGVCVFQLYESNKSILDDIYLISTKVGFIGKYIIDNPQSKKKKKFYLYLEKE
jgi:18S rRNA (guanine1575-N7)-methyltransferase